LFGERHREQILDELSQAAQNGYDLLTVSVHSGLDGTVIIYFQI
jgi:hypothetical protein